MDHFSSEIIASGVKDSVAWRSHVLNPILQRQLHGYSDYDGHMLSKHFEGKRGEDLDHLVYEFYLKVDPLDPQQQPLLRRSILYITEARWFLGRSGSGSDDCVERYSACFKRTLELFLLLKDQKPEPIKLQHFELDIIVEEKLESYFLEDCRDAVGPSQPANKVFAR